MHIFDTMSHVWISFCVGNVQSLQRFPCNLILFFVDGVVKWKFSPAT